MIKRRYFMAWMVLVLLLLVPIGRTNGCVVYYFRDEYRMVFFNPRLIADSTLQPFLFYFDPPFAYSAKQSEKTDYLRNCQEWVDYLGSSVRLQEVQEVIYQSSSEQVLDAIHVQHLQDLFPNNTFVKKLLEPKHRDALDYLELAMQAEFTHFADTDPWGLNESLLDFKRDIKAVIKTAQNKLKTTKDPFLTQRYAYQVVLQCRYAGMDELCLKYCDQYLPLEHPGSVLIPWAQFHKAAVLTKKKEFAASAYVLSRVFDLSESKKPRIHLVLDREPLEKAVSLAKTPKEKATILALLSYKTPGRSLPYLQQIAQLNPASRYLPQLILREINKIEDWLLTAKFTFFGKDEAYGWEGKAADDYMPIEDRGLWMKEIPYLQKNFKKDLAYLRQVSSWIEDLLQKPGFPDQNFGHLAAAHLSYLGHQPAQANLHLQKVSARKNTTAHLQKILTQLLILPDLMDIQSPEAKTQIVQYFYAIRGQAALLDHQLNIYPKLMLYFSRLYQKKGDVVTAGLLHRRGMTVPTSEWRDWRTGYYAPISYFDRFGSLQDLDKLITLVQQKQLSTFEKFLTDTLSTPEKHSFEPYGWEPESYNKPISTLPSLGQLYDLKGTIAFRQNRLHTALAAFEKLPANYWEDNYEFSSMFTHDIFVDAESFPWDRHRSGICNKAVVVKKMIELQELAAKPGPRQAEAAYILANAYFNTSYWGHSWMMYSYSWSRNDWGAPLGLADEKAIYHPNSKGYHKVYFQLSRAMRYYQRTLFSSSDPELAAKAMYMIGYCDKYAKFGNGELDYYPWKDQKVYVSPVFNTFRARFNHTLTYYECLKTCPELADYVKSR